MADHQGQGGGCPVHVPCVSATVRGERWCHRAGQWPLTGIIMRARPMAFTALLGLLMGLVVWLPVQD